MPRDVRMLIASGDVSPLIAPGEAIPVEFDQTISAAWLRRLAGPRGVRTHWQTKMTYYRAVARLLRDGRGHAVNWYDVVESAQPRGSRSTFYEVTGPRAKHALMDQFIAAAAVDSLQLAVTYQRGNAVHQLIDETKVWSYWPLREGWVSACRGVNGLTVEQATVSLAAVLGEWSRREPALSKALDNAPPVCAIEDLMCLHRGKLPAIRAQAILRPAMVSVVGDPPDPERETRRSVEPRVEVMALPGHIYALRRGASGRGHRRAPAASRPSASTERFIERVGDER